MNEQILIPLLTFISVGAVGGAVIAARSARQQSIAKRLKDLEEFEDTLTPSSNKMMELLRSAGESVIPKGPSAKLGERLAQAGYFSSSAAAVFMGIKLSLFLVCLVAAGSAMTRVSPEIISTPGKAIVVLALAGLGYMTPNLVVASRRRRRSSTIRHHLPDAVDLLEICVGAGMGLDMAWNAVADEIRRVCGELADEMALANLETHLGAQRATAIRNMARRTNVEELNSLVAVLVQSERFGTSISDALCVFATSMREIRRTRAEEAAEKMAVKLLFPMVLFIFPSILIVTAGPAAIKIAELLGSG